MNHNEKPSKNKPIKNKNELNVAPDKPEPVQAAPTPVKIGHGEFGPSRQRPAPTKNSDQPGGESGPTGEKPSLAQGEFGPRKRPQPMAPAPPASVTSPISDEKKVESAAGQEKSKELPGNARTQKSGFSPHEVAENFAAPTRPRRIWRKICLALLALFILALAAGGYLAYEVHSFLSSTPVGATQENVEVEIMRGDTFSKAANRLETAGVISNALYFRLYAMWEGRTASVQAGIFEFSTQWTPEKVLQHLVFGQPVLYRLTIPEGLPWWEVAKLVEEGGFATADDFKAVIHDPDFLAKQEIPFDSAEGFLFPDTYFLRKPKVMDKESALGLATRMVSTFQKKTRDLFAGLDMTPDKIKNTIILASMVEKETAIDTERPLVAGVFTNRMALNMLMQCDPTIIYGLGEKFSGNIRRRDLEDDSNLYNTYRHAGLPPGPICSPGLASIAAAVHPAQTDYLYFVATKPGGAHVFNANLKDHNAAVNKYQR